MRKLVTVIAALVVAFSMMWFISSDAQAYTLRSCTVQKITLNGQMTYSTGILVPADMLVTEAKWKANATDSYAAKHFYQGDGGLVTIEHRGSECVQANDGVRRKVRHMRQVRKDGDLVEVFDLGGVEYRADREVRR